MLSRRNLRVKVMQVLYSVEHGNHLSTEEALRMLQKNIDKAYALLFFDLSLFVRITDFIKREAGVKTTKYLPTEADLRFSTKLADNPFISVLRTNRKIQDLLRLTLNEEETAVVKDVLKNLLEKDEYIKYCDLPAGDLAAEREVMTVVFDVIMKSSFHQLHVEDNFPECVSELGKINFTVSEMLARLAPEAQNGLPDIADAQAEVDFARELLEKTMADHTRFTELIQPKLKNWDLDRIASLDMILMKMALCELLHFENIPIKVSINEYIDIAKLYSTPRSKDFINGILDNIMHDLKQSNEIKKTGRGLVE